MAKKRMFDKSIIETDNFLNISLTAKALYFLLGMEADDEGFISPTRVIRLYGGEIGDLQNLINTGLIIPFKSGVVVITDWHTNNYLDSRRGKPTRYQEEKAQLTLIPVENKTGFTNDKKYVLSTCLADVQPEENRIEENRIEENTSDKLPDLNKLIDLFKDVNPTYTRLFSNKTERKSLERLVNQFGIDKITNTIKGLSNIIYQPYAPRITTPYELEKNLAKLIAFVNQNKNLLQKKSSNVI